MTTRADDTPDSVSDNFVVCLVAVLIAAYAAWMMVSL